MIAVLTALLIAQAPQPEARVTLSGYVQPQYEVASKDGDTRDRTLFRRLFFTLNAAPSEHWRGEFQVDAGRLASFGERPVIKSAFVQFTGWEHRGLVVTIGNQKPPLSRSLLASSSRRGLVERPFTGDRSLGAPGRAPLVKLEGTHADRRVYWAAAIGTSRQVPDPDEVRVDGPAEAGIDGTNEGPLAGARVEWHPLGEAVREHGDFEHRPFRFTVGAAAYGWWNDEDVGTHGPHAVDASSVRALEVSGAIRGGGISVDAEYQRVDACALGGNASLGVYRDGRARLHKGSVEGGYMLVRSRLEAVGMFDVVNANAFDATWQRLSAGMNWYVKRHDLKFSILHRESFDERGVRGDRSHTTYVQTQFVF